MLTKNTKNNLLIYFLFWAVYAPLALIHWAYSDRTLLGISILMLIGAGIILGALFVKEKFFYKKRIKIQARPKSSIEFTEEVEDPDNFVGFRKLFSQNKQYGGEAI